MIIPPLALLLGGVLGLLLRGRRRSTATLAWATPALSLLAMLAQYLPIGGAECESTSTGSQVCRSLPGVAFWGGPEPYLIALVLIVLSFAPLLTLGTGRRWPTILSALLQAVPQVVSFGGFLAWGPALFSTCAFAFAFRPQPAARAAASMSVKLP